MASTTQPTLLSMTAAPSTDLMSLHVNIEPARGDGGTKATPQDSPPLPKLKPLHAPRQNPAVLSGLKRMYRARNAIVSPPSLKSKDRNDFLDLLTKIAAGRHPQDLLSQSSFQNSVGNMTEADLVTHLARFAAHSWGISDEDISLERKMTIMMPERVGDEPGVVVIGENGWLRLASESDSGTLRHAVDEDNVSNEDNALAEAGNFASAIESHHENVIDGVLPHPLISMTEPASVSKGSAIANVTGSSGSWMAVTTDNTFAEVKNTTESNDGFRDQRHTEKLAAKHARIKSTMGAQFQTNLLWPLDNNDGDGLPSSHAISTTPTLQQIDNGVTSTKKRKLQETEDESSKKRKSEESNTVTPGAANIEPNHSDHIQVQEVPLSDLED